MNGRWLFALLLILLVPGAAAAQAHDLAVLQEGPLLRVSHAAEYNCAVFTIEHDCELRADTLEVRELALAAAWMDCYCPYRSQLEITGLVPGEYVLSYWYTEAEPGLEPPGGWHQRLLPFTMAEPTGDQGELVLTARSQGCGLMPTSVPSLGDRQEAQTWTAVKALF
jgi:hypothetical protein